jgi:hypothetical protein
MAKGDFGSSGCSLRSKGLREERSVFALRQKREELRERGIIPVSGETVRGTPVFQELVANPPASEEEFRGLWKLYFLSLIGQALRRIPVRNEQADTVTQALEHAHLLVPGDWSLGRMLRAALDYARRLESISAEVKLGQMTGQPEGLEAKLTIREPGTEERQLGYVSADSQAVGD